MALMIKKAFDTSEKLEILSQDSRYDLACACATAKHEHRKRSKDNKWVYPVVLPNGGTTYLFKTLLSNVCANDCKYCPLRSGSDTLRCSLSPEELAKTFLSYYRARRVSGLFLSSAVNVNADNTMERINRTALILRKAQFRGYIHLKIIPGSSDGAIRQALALSSAVSLNIETAGENNFKHLSNTKDYSRDILRPIQLISRLTTKGAQYAGVKQTTQFVVGASKETDREIINYSGRLYKELGLSRIYFSAYQRGRGAPDLPGEHLDSVSSDLLTREHRLYQVDWLIRKYGFKAEEVPVNLSGNLSLDIDPKEMWARLHPEFFPVNVNKDDRFRLSRVPGLGLIMVDKILALRNQGIRIPSFERLSKLNKNLHKAKAYVAF